LETSLSQNPRLRSNDVRNKVVKKLNTSISKSKAQWEMAMALKNVHGSFQYQYRQIYDYAHELMRANLGSIVKVKVEDINDFKVFNRFYVCLKAYNDNFISCRPIIALDGCFLKGFYGGELLTTVGKDPNDQMLPLVECKESWSWFLQILIEDLGGVDVCQGITFMFDQQKVYSLLTTIDFVYV